MQQWTGFSMGNEVLLDLLLSEPHSIPPNKDCVRTEGTRVDSCYKKRGTSGFAADDLSHQTSNYIPSVNSSILAL